MTLSESEHFVIRQSFYMLELHVLIDHSANSYVYLSLPMVVVRAYRVLKNLRTFMYVLTQTPRGVHLKADLLIRPYPLTLMLTSANIFNEDPFLASLVK